MEFIKATDDKEADPTDKCQGVTEQSIDNQEDQLRMEIDP